MYAPEGPNVEAPLRIGGEVTLGIGGEPAFEFTLPKDLPKGVNSSTGFLKLFVANRYIDLEWIEQNLSPFDSTFMGSRSPVLKTEVLPTDEPTWDALTVTLTMVK
jgi:hypothetical protein